MTTIKNVITPLSANPAALKEYHRLVRTFGAEEAKVQLARNFNVAPTLQEVAEAERAARGTTYAELQRTNPFEAALYARNNPDVHGSGVATEGSSAVEALERAKHPQRNDERDRGLTTFEALSQAHARAVAAAEKAVAGRPTNPPAAIDLNPAKKEGAQ